MTNNEMICSVIDEYIKENGRTDKIWSNAEIQKLVRTKYPNIPNSSIMPRDLCYNRCNGTDNQMIRDFANWPHALKRLGEGEFILLGTNYPYTGMVYHYIKAEGITCTFGEWFNGVFTKYAESKCEPIEQYESREREYIAETDAALEQAVGLEREHVAKIRVNQGLFREKMLRRYSGCVLCRIKEPGVLIASHIKPWCDCNPEEKLDVNNGFLLCPNHDKLFDQGYISFDDDGKILISDRLSETDRILMNVRGTDTIKLCEENIKYLSYHRKRNGFN